jgi:hypothetical protein
VVEMLQEICRFNHSGISNRFCGKQLGRAKISLESISFLKMAGISNAMGARHRKFHYVTAGNTTD